MQSSYGVEKLERQSAANLVDRKTFRWMKETFSLKSVKKVIGLSKEKWKDLELYEYTKYTK